MKLLLYKNQKGFSIIEAITASVLLITAILVFFTIQGRQLTQFSNFRDLEKIDYSANGIFEELEAIRSNNGPIGNYSDVNLLNTSTDPIITNFRTILSDNLGDSVSGDVRQLTVTSSGTGAATVFTAKVRIKKGDIDQTLERKIY